MSRLEIISRLDQPAIELAPGIAVHMLATGSMGSKGLSTSIGVFQPQAILPWHHHPCSEVIIVLDGEVTASVEGREYELKQFDALHIPANTAHSTVNLSGKPATLHSSFASDVVSRTLIENRFSPTPKVRPDAGDPESLVRFVEAPTYDLANQAQFRDLFAARLGAKGICGGYGRFQPGASLPCHYHVYDESITIIEGEAVCLVAGRKHTLSNNGTACIPTGVPHRFLNWSDQPMAMIWVYAGDEPARTIVAAGCCDGTTPCETFIPA